jgi:predicted PurR-regulated permease PerM
VPVLYREMFVILKEIKYFLLNLRYKGIFSFLYEHIDSFSIKIINYIQNNIFLFLSKSINIISSLITILVLTLCFLLNYDKFFSFIKSFLIKKKPRLYFLLVNINRELSSYITGIGIIMIVEIIEYTIIYRIIGHPNYLLLAALTSLTTIIPFVGGLISNIIAIITASVVSKRVFILTSIVVILMPIIDSYLIQPRIYKKTNQIPTFLSIVIVIVGGLIFKVVGIMIAIPLYIIIKNILKLTFLDKYDIM